MDPTIHNDITKRKVIVFGRSSPNFLQLSNFYPAAVFLDNMIWPSSEHYYQAKKFLDLHLEERIRQAKEATDAFAYTSTTFAFVSDSQHYSRRLSHSSEAAKHIRSDWQNVKLHVMQRALVAKFTQHPDLRQLLLDTGPFNATVSFN